MKLNIEKEMAALRRMTIGQLREKFTEVFNEPTRSFHREFLIRKIIWRKQAVAEGDLSERARQRALEIANDADLRLRPPARLRLVGVDDAPVVTKVVKAPTTPGLPTPRTVIARQYKGRRICVKVLERGFEYEGERYRSLTAIARTVTNLKWNGPLFFGIKPAAPGKRGEA